jgi:hypothetical protein
LGATFKGGVRERLTATDPTFLHTIMLLALGHHGHAFAVLSVICSSCTSVAVLEGRAWGAGTQSRDYLLLVDIWVCGI